jgi:hypothetical protein
MTDRELNDIMEFEHVIEVREDGSIIDRNDLYAPDCYFDQGVINYSGDRNWTALDGYSGQEGYSGPIMHASEYIGGRMEADIRSTPGIYATVIITDPDDGEPAGWAVVKHIDNQETS